MNLTEAESKALHRLQKNRKQFQKMKWVFVCLIILMMAAFCFAANTMASIPVKLEGKIELQALAYSTILPMLMLISIMTGVIIGTTIKNWIGDPVQTLIIGIAERLEKESDPVDCDQ